MERIFVFIAIVCLCNICITEAKPSPYYASSLTPQRTCGTELTNRLMHICQNAGGFYVYNRKRDTTTQLQLLARDEDLNVYYHRRVKRNVNRECCAAICTDDDIRMKFCKAQDPEEQ